MLISHESPLCLLEKSRTYNDYDYALVHLFDKYPQYFNFFKTSLKEHKREVLLDNSIFELKKAFDADLFADWVVKLQPTYYIVPDALEDVNTTILQFEVWKSKYGKLPGKKIGVVQGKTLPELIECYKYMASNADYIAISFDYSYYQTCAGINYCNYYNYNPKLAKWMYGRLLLIDKLKELNVWNDYIPVHLLGCSLPIEFGMHNTTNIRSCDTSNPIMAGINNWRYGTNGLTEKPVGLLADNLEIVLSDVQQETIEYNVQAFKKLTNK